MGKEFFNKQQNLLSDFFRSLTGGLVSLGVLVIATPDVVGGGMHIAEK